MLPVAQIKSQDPVSAQDSMIREVVGLFPSADALQNAIRDLEGTAFPRQDISVMASETELEKVFGSKSVAGPEFQDFPADHRNNGRAKCKHDQPRHFPDPAQCQ